MKFQHISFKSSEKTHLLGFFFVRKDVSMPRSSPTANGRGTASWGFSAELLGSSRLSTDRLPSGARFRTRARMGGSPLPSRNQSCQQMLLHQSTLLPVHSPLLRPSPNKSRINFISHRFLSSLSSFCISQPLHFVVVF